MKVSIAAVDDATANPPGREPGFKSRSALLVATGLGVAGALLLMLYQARFEEEISGGERVPLLTLRKPVARGELITDDALTVSEVPGAYAEQRAVRQTDRSKVVGVRTSHALEPQDTLTWSDLALSSENRDLSSLVAPGKRAITVRAAESGGDDGIGLVRPGDYVDVLATLNPSDAASAAVVLQRVLVLAVGGETQPQAFVDSKDARGGGYGKERQLTLSMKLEEAQLLSLARARGKLSVALRGPDDSKVIEGIGDMPLSNLYDKAVRETVQRTRETPSRPGPTRVGAGVP